MIGVFDSGYGGLTILKSLQQMLPCQHFVYVGDHHHAPYGNRPHEDVVTLTQYGVDQLFNQGCTLVILGCNSATAIAARALQQDWLPQQHPNKKILGIIAPTVEAATQTPWSVKTPQYPQKYNTDHFLVFGTALTINSKVYEEEIRKRCPQAKIIQQACPHLAGAIEKQVPEEELRTLVHDYVHQALCKADKQTPHWALLGCTHFPLVKELFEEALPPQTRVLDQPITVAYSLQDYLARHSNLVPEKEGSTCYFTTGDVKVITPTSIQFLEESVTFESMTPFAF